MMQHPLSLHVAFILLVALSLLGVVEASTVRGVDRWDIYHPLDEGLWSEEKASTSTDELGGGDELEEEEVDIDDKLLGLRNHLRMAEIDSLRLFSKTPLPRDVMKPMTYDIFQKGQSALRSLEPQDQPLIQPETLFGLADKSLCRPAHYRACAALLLLRGYSDAAHEVLLGVTLDNLNEGEYAATHRGQTNWAQEHPLTDGADMLHAAIHRIVEGKDLGEGDQTGYENANYWLAGGPKKRETPAALSVRQALVRIAKQHTPLCVRQTGVIAKEAAQHTIPAGGGETRTVCVPSGQWDDFAFLELCKLWADGLLDKDMEDEVATLQRAEIILLLRQELMDCLGRGAVREE